MNKIFKVIWNHSTQNWIAVSELSTTRGKSSSSTDKRIEPAKVLSTLAIGLGMLISGSVLAATEFTSVNVVGELTVGGELVVTGGTAFSGGIFVGGVQTVDMGGNQVNNMKDGKISATSNDAINGRQLYSVADKFNAKLGDVYNKLNRNNRDLRAGIAGTNAAASLPQVYLPGKSMVAASAGTYKGESAVAVGYSRASNNGKLILKLQGNANTRGDIGGGVGIGYQW